MLPSKYPEQTLPLPFLMPGPQGVRIFRVRPTIISELDYTKGLGHTNLVICCAATQLARRTAGGANNTDSHSPASR